jgi:hypothetical protein
MRSLALPAVAVLLAAGPAFAASEGKFSAATVNGITKSLEADGCKMGEIHSGSGSYTVAGAARADGKYDVIVDTDFKITEKKKKE